MSVCNPINIVCVTSNKAKYRVSRLTGIDEHRVCGVHLASTVRGVALGGRVDVLVHIIE